MKLWLRKANGTNSPGWKDEKSRICGGRRQMPICMCSTWVAIGIQVGISKNGWQYNQELSTPTGLMVQVRENLPLPENSVEKTNRVGAVVWM